MIRAKLDLLKFTGAKSFTAKDGTEFIAIPIAANGFYVGAKGTYSDLTLMDNRDGTNSYGDDGFIAQDLSKEKREQGIKGAILGNWKHVGDSRPAQGARSPEYGQREAPRNSGPGMPAAPAMDDFDDNDQIPF